MNLFDSFNPVAPSHAHDPASSVAAATLMTSTGTAQLHAETVRDLVRANPDCTSAELDNTYQTDIRWRNGPTMDLTEIRRRLNTCLNLRWLIQGPQRKCRVKGRLMVVWRPADATVEAPNAE